MMPLREMNLADMDEVMRIEQSVHTHPWTHGNFTDALNSDSVCKVYEEAEEMLGYVVLMPAVDEMQLLNISIAARHQRKGLGRRLLSEIMEIARGMNMRRMLLEVRTSNVAALGLYCDAGFSEIGLRRGYYRADNGREDAIVMECVL
jgi:ribosomal-protein-alanine N-acetyltransferase